MTRHLWYMILCSLLIVACDKEQKLEYALKRHHISIAEPRVADTNHFIPDYTQNNCAACHDNIEPIRDPASGMMQAIYDVAKNAGFPHNDCIVCHGGNPESTSKENAHNGTINWFMENKGPINFYPDPGSVWINQHTCGMCHAEQVSTQFTSLMFTEAGKIQGTTWGFGALHGKEHNVANVPVKDLDIHEQLGSEVYKKYMAELEAAEPQIFPDSMMGLPEAPTEELLNEDPRTAVYTYLRQDCQRCHTGVKGQQADGDYRGMGCSACHIPYSNKGLYEGLDPTIPKEEKGHLLVHQMQGTRDAKVKVHDHEYSGIPTKTCTACHNRGRRIGVSYEGLMETSYHAPYMSNASDQAKIHKKQYLHLQPDVHLTKGMLCQDCHTSGDAHSLGNLTGAIQGAVEIECTDCHGTPQAYPWELPIGYGDEIVGKAPKVGKARGVSGTIPDYLKQGTEVDPRDGYLFSARGNPMPHLVKEGDQVILYSAGGKDIILDPLKKLNNEGNLSLAAHVAMVQTQGHIDEMECYACHATWAPQCYGCHINMDFSKETMKTDWVGVANNANEHGLTQDAISMDDLKKIQAYVTSGKIKEERSYLRWEDPPLAVNGDHRISPAIPGCQTTITLKNKQGHVLLKNHIYQVKGEQGDEGNGQLAIDMAPLQPHTVQAGSRACESCHTNTKAMGHGIASGKLFYKPDTNFVMDLMDAYGRPIAHQVDTHFNAIENLSMDWSRFVDEQGHQLQTVGHHLSGSRALNKEELAKLDRRGVCISCHQTVPEEDIASDILSHIAKYTDVKMDNEKHNEILNKSIQISAWFQLLWVPGILTLLLIGYKMKKKWKS